jgi:hypothetical protein
MQSLNRRFLLIGALGAIVQLHPAAVFARQPEGAPGIIAAQLQKQGVACTMPRGAVPDPENSRPHEAVWTLRCDEASYRVRLVPHRRARITPICREVSEGSYAPQRLGKM